MILGKNINELSKEVFQKVKTGQLKINIIHLPTFSIDDKNNC